MLFAVAEHGQERLTTPERMLRRLYWVRVDGERILSGGPSLAQ